MNLSIPIKPISQPRPFIAPNGDCVACCLSAVSGKSLEEIYSLAGHKSGFTYDLAIHVLSKLAIPYENFLPRSGRWTNNPEYFTFGSPSWQNFIEWWELSRFRVARGLVGLAPVNFNGQANIEDTFDHFVIINGLSGTDDTTVDNLVHFSCSAKGDFQVHPKEFLWKWGGYNAIWVKPVLQN